MSTKINPYPSYGETKVPWLNEAPAHWQTVRLDRLFDLRNEPPQEGDGRVTGYIDGRVTLRSNVAGQKIKGVIHEGGWQRIYPGDFAISGMNAHLGGMGVSDALGKCSPIYLVLQPKPATNAHYVSLAVRQAAHLGAIKALVQTIRFNSADMKRADLKSIYVQVPPPEEQDGIVRFIRYIDQRVNRLLKTKRRLIKLLNEQKQAIIHQAVTRGLDPDVPLKPSEVEWLGDVPEHWEIKRLKYVAPEASTKVAQKPVDLPYIGLENIEARTGRLLLAGAAEVVESAVNEFKAGDILFGKLRPYLAKVVRVDFTGVCTTEALVLRPTPDVNGRFLACLLLSNNFISEVNAGTYGSKMPRANSGQIGNISIAYPGLSEQQKIVGHITSETAPFDNAITKAQAEIDFIREYRTRLVSDVVTGQLDVRGLALPEVEDEVVSLEDEGGELDEGPGEDEEGAEE